MIRCLDFFTYNSASTVQVSTSILAILRATFLTPFQRIALQILFSLTFFFTRILLTPWLMYTNLTTLYYFQGECVHPAIFWITLIFSIFFITLNFFCKFCDHSSLSAFPCTLSYNIFSNRVLQVDEKDSTKA